MTNQSSWRVKMKNLLTNKVVAGLLILGLGVAIGKYTLPAKIVTIEHEATSENRNVEVVVVEKKAPDGSSTKTTVTKDKSIVNTEKDKKVEVKNEKSNVRLDALIGYDFREKRQVYGVQVQKRFVGPILLGAWGTNQGTAGLSVGVEF